MKVARTILPFFIQMILHVNGWCMEWKLYKMKIEQAFFPVKFNFLETTEKGPSNKILFVSLPNTTEK